MNDSNDLAEAIRVVAVLERQKNDPRCPKHHENDHAPSMLLDECGVPILLDGEPIAFGDLVMKSTIVHPRTITCSTLQSVVDFFATEESAGHLVQIESPSAVHVLSILPRLDGLRDHPIEAIYTRGAKNLFGQWFPVDDFCSWLLGSFVAVAKLGPPKVEISGDRTTGAGLDSQGLKRVAREPGEGVPPKPPADRPDELAALYKTIENKVTYDAVNAVGDGNKSIAEGILIEWSGGIGPRFRLRFICTFPEVDQPERACACRFRRHDGEIEIKLLDADGGAWAQTAITSISTWLRGQEELADVTILG